MDDFFVGLIMDGNCFLFVFGFVLLLIFGFEFMVCMCILIFLLMVIWFILIKFCCIDVLLVFIE